DATTLTVWVGDQAITLADLEDSTVGSRRPPGGQSILVRGRAAGVFVEAEFFSGQDAVAPVGSIAVTVYPDRYLPSVRGVRFFQVTGALPGPGPLTALINGYHSWSDDRIETVGPELPPTLSHGALGLTRAGRGLGLVFDGGEPGEA